MKSLSQLFTAELHKSPEFTEAITVLNHCNLEPRWLIGGFVFRTLASLMYDIPRPVRDLDIIILKEATDLHLPMGWNAQRNSFGNYKFIKNDLVIDVIPLHRLHPLRAANLEPTIENMLLCTPLTIQSIAYDLSTHKLIGDIGLHALETRTIAPHYLPGLTHITSLYGISPHDYLLKKNESLNFKYDV